MSTTVDAEDGRIYIPKEVREKFGTKFKIIERKDKIVLLPVPDDPLERLREITSDTDKSAQQLKKEAREYMMEEAGR